MLSYRAPASIAAFLTLALVACGSPQTIGTQGRGDGGACEDVSDRLRESRLDSALACWAGQGPDGATQCRAVSPFAADVSPEGLNSAASCVLAAGERSDGAWLAEVLNSVAARPDAVRAIVSAMGEHFEESQHGNSFSAALASAAQTALGQGLGSYTEAEQRLIVSLGMSYAMSPLDQFCMPYAGLLPTGHPGLQTLAAAVPIDSAVAPDERRVLTAGGVWDARDVINCYQRDQRGCSSWDGESPLQLLALMPPTAELSPAPDNAIAMMQQYELEAADAEAVVRWLVQTDYPNRADMMQRLLQDVTNPDRPLGNRLAIGRAASGVLCDGQGIFNASTRLSTEDFTPEPAGSPWVTLLETCAPEMDTEDLLWTLAAGGKLAVPASTFELLRERLAASIGSATCDQTFATADAIRNASSGSTVSAVVYAEGAAAHGDACSGTFHETMRRVTRVRDHHPASRIRTAHVLLEQGDSSACGDVSAMMNWSDDQTDFGPGAFAEEAADAFRAACR